MLPTSSVCGRVQALIVARTATPITERPVRRRTWQDTEVFFFEILQLGTVRLAAELSVPCERRTLLWLLPSRAAKASAFDERR